MSVAANDPKTSPAEDVPPAATLPSGLAARPAAAGSTEPAAPAAEGDPAAALVEADDDARETPMTYDAGRAPWWVLAVWAVALSTFAWYALTFLFPDLRAWTSP